MDGRADKQSVFAIIEAVAPITTVILHGSLKGKKCLQEKCAEHCSKVTVAQTYHEVHVCVYIFPRETVQVLVPAQGSTMEVSSRTVMFEARIWDDVYSGLKFQQVGPLEAGYVDAVWDGGGGDGLSLRQYLCE